MRIETERLVITEFTLDMARAVHLGSLDEDTRRFLPDEVFETEDAAREVIADLMGCYGGTDGPLVYPMLHGGEYAGYVQAVPCEDGWEIGYHTAAGFTGRGFATEAVRAFLPVVMEHLGIAEMAGVCLTENAASVRVLEKCGFRRVFEGLGMYQGDMRPIVKMVYAK